MKLKRKCKGFSDDDIQKSLDDLVEKGILVKFWNEDDNEFKYIDKESYQKMKDGENLTK